MIPVRTGVLEIVLFMVHSKSNRCDTRCVEAVGFECECECAGANHGGMTNMSDWKLVGDTTLIANDKEYSMRTYTVESYYG